MHILVTTTIADQYFILFPSSTAVTFALTHQVLKPVWAISFRVLTVDSTFQYHVNLFTNVYAIGARTLTSKSKLDVLIDYNALATSYGYLHRTFSTINGSDYSMNKIVSFISCLGFYSNAGPPIADVTTSIVNSTHFYYHFYFGTGVYVDRYHFNAIIFDQGQMEATNLFRMHYYHVNFSSSTGGEYPVPQ